MNASLFLFENEKAVLGDRRENKLRKTSRIFF